MAIPIPTDFVELTVSAAPQGWGGYLPDFFNLIGQSISGQLQSSFLIGQVGGSKPAHDIGPWFDTSSNEWWWFDPATGQYQPGEQGTAVGTIALWGGGNSLPRNWLACDGSQVSRYTYSRLFQAVGETWGPGDGQTSFNLPPGGVIFFNASGFTALEEVSLGAIPTAPGQPTATANPSGVASVGGSQLSRLLLGSDLPGLTVPIRIRWQNYANADEPKLPGTNIPNLQAPGSATISYFTFPLRDMSGNPLGPNQQQFSIMPPFCTMIHMIKYL
jgi:hypothetical protein